MQGIAGFTGNLGIFKTAQAGLTGIGTAATHSAGGIRILTGALHGLVPVLTAVTGVASAFAAVAKSIGTAAGEETAVFQFKNVAGGAAEADEALKRMRQGAKETATPYGQYVQMAKGLMQVGLSANEAADMTKRFQQIQSMTGTSASEVADIFERATMKEDLSMRDLAKLRGIPGIDAIARQFKGLEHATQDADFATKQQQIHLAEEAEAATYAYEEQAAQMTAAFEKENREMSLAYDLAEKNADAIASIGEKVGIAKDAFDSWKMGGSMQGVGDLGGFGSLVSGQLVAGLQQLQKETGLSMDQIRMFAQQGKIGVNDLLEAARRAREEQRKQAEEKRLQEQAEKRFAIEEAHRQEMHRIELERLKLEAEQMERQRALLEEQRDLFAQVADAIKNAFSPETFTKFFDTFDGKMRQLWENINELFQKFGAPIIEGLKPVLDMINNEWMPALQDAATNFGNWLVTEAQEFFKAFQEGDWSTIEGQIKGVLDTAANFFVQALGGADFSILKDKIYPFLGAAAHGFVDALGDADFSKLGAKLQQELGNALEALKKSFDDAKFGEKFGEALANGVDFLEKALEKVVIDLAGILANAFGEAFQVIFNEMGQYFQQIGKAFQEHRWGDLPKLLLGFGEGSAGTRATTPTPGAAITTPPTPEPGPPQASIDPADFQDLLAKNQEQIDALSTLNRTLGAVLQIA